MRFPHTTSSPTLDESKFSSKAKIQQFNEVKRKMTLEFFVPMVPPTVTHQEKRVNWSARKFYEDDNLKAARQKLAAYIGRHRPESPITGGVRLTTKWCFPNGRHADGEYRTSKPDTDNLQKLLKDVMTQQGFWKDDALVASEITEKFWAKIPGIYIRVEEL